MNSIAYRQELSSAFAEWLNRYEWDWWATFTFRLDRKPYGARKSFIYFLKQLKSDSTYFLAVEWHRYRYSVHCHALVGNVGDIRRLTVMDSWFARYGICRIWPYDRTRGAKYYLSKYLVKDLADWDFKFDQQKQFKFP